jgi:hypothetical protein
VQVQPDRSVIVLRLRGVIGNPDNLFERIVDGRLIESR